MPLRFSLALVVAAGGLLLYQYFGIRQVTGNIEFPDRVTEARNTCTDPYGAESVQSNQLSRCNRKCLQDTLGDVDQQCINNCPKQIQAFASCLIGRTTPPPSHSFAR